jgi:hypothetical protein
LTVSGERGTRLVEGGSHEGRAINDGEDDAAKRAAEGR